MLDHLAQAGSDARHLIRHAAPLVFGIFGTLGDGSVGREDDEVREGGSGIFIAPFLAITARHVSKDLYQLGGREEARRFHQSLHAAHLFQCLDPFNPESSEKSLWHVDRSWSSPHTDITLLQVSAENEIAKRLQVEMPSRFFEWHLSPPLIGSTVYAIGFPQLRVRPDGRDVICSAPFTLQELQVTQVYPLGRDKGMLNFPCFEVDDSVDHGFSGGPVFYKDKLCGIVTSGSTFDSRSHIALLWPLTLMDYRNEFGGKSRFGDLLDRGVIAASDWREIRNRISKGENEFGDPCLFINAEKPTS
jgi:hypothetical protein